MRLWSIHPSLLDRQGFVALWRESLLAKKVLLGQTKGYTKHPQLIRFQQTNYPIHYIDQYLYHLHQESIRRHYHFDQKKFDSSPALPTIPITNKQYEYEINHLKNKLTLRQPELLTIINQLSSPLLHPIFHLTKGPIANWEKTK